MSLSLRGPATALALMAAIGATTTGVRAEKKAWWLDVEGGVEYSDNAAANPNLDNDIIGVSDDFAATIEIDAGYKFVDTETTRVEVGYDFYQSLYSDMDELNYREHNPSLNAWTKIDGVKLGVTYNYVNSSLDNGFFLEQHSFQPSIATYLTEQLYLSVFYRYLDKNYNAADNGRDANTHQGGADLYYYFDKADRGYVSLGGGFTSEDTEGAAFDYDGWSARAAVQIPIELFGKDGRLRFSYAYQHREYDNDVSLLPANDSLSREDDRHTARARLEIDMTDDLKAIGEYRYINRDSNLATADYQENVGSVSLRYSF